MLKQQERSPGRAAPSWFHAAQRHAHLSKAPSFERTRASARSFASGHSLGQGAGHAEAASARVGKSASRFLVAGLVAFSTVIGILLYFGEEADQSRTRAPADGASLFASTSSESKSGSVSIVDASLPLAADRPVPGPSAKAAVQPGGRFSGSEKLLGASLDQPRARSHTSEIPSEIPSPDTGSQGSGSPARPVDGDQADRLAKLEQGLANRPQLSPAEKDILRDLAQRGSGSEMALSWASAKSFRAATGTLPEHTQRALLPEDTSAEVSLFMRRVAPANYQKSSRVASASDREAQAPPIYGIQLVSVSREQTAHRVWEKYRRDFASVLADLEPVIERAQVEGGTVYRVQTGPFPDRANADAVCALLKERGAGCLVFRR